MNHRVRTIALALPLAVLPFKANDDIPGSPRAQDGYVLTMEFVDRSTESTFKIEVLNGRFRVELDEVIPIVGRVLNAGAGLANASQFLSNATTMTAGGYMFVQDSGKVAIVLPSANMAMSINPGMLAGARQAMRARGAGGGRGARGGAGAGAGAGAGRAGGAGGRAGRAGRNARGAPPDSAARPRRRAFGTDSNAVNAVTVQDLGVGEKMLGHATHKYRFHVSSPLNTGGSCENAKSDDVITDGWFAADLSDGGFISVFSLLPLFRGGAAPVAGPDPLASSMPRGMPMKLVALCDMPSRDPVGTLKVTKIEAKTIDAAEFEIPDGLPVIDPATLFRGRGAGRGRGRGGD